MAMRIENSTTNYQQVSVSLLKADSVANDKTLSGEVLPSTIVESARVSISGKALMISRLFGGAEPEVKSGSDGMSIHNIGISSVNYLSQKDRDLVSKMYAFAQQQGADLQYVDTLAIDLGSYRKTDNGRIMMGFNNGTSFDLEGHLVKVSFNVQDTKTVESILNSKSIKSTEIDHGFLQYTLDASTGALSSLSNLQFLEKMVTKFSSDAASSTTSLSEEFSTFSRSDATVNRTVFTKSKEVLSPYPAADFVADYTSIDGVGFWRTPELAAANSGQSNQSSQNLNTELLKTLLSSDADDKRKDRSADLLTLLSKVKTLKA